MSTDQFNQSVNAEIKRLIQQGEATQVCSAGEWPEDMGGNWTPDRIAANHSFSDWLDSHQDAIVPTSMSEWLQQNDDSIFIE